ncbi:hypothetical protein ACIBHX_46915 [Nonomuraea sp. NPDC050536]|uniref:hypothetical protein n=1 Tax=Nonomuraea sp. NPDC050536 TaxID=3364366 RepID=UPI0037C8BBAC
MIVMPRYALNVAPFEPLLLDSGGAAPLNALVTLCRTLVAIRIELRQIEHHVRNLVWVANPYTRPDWAGLIYQLVSALEATCSVCDGRGGEVPAAWQSWRQREQELQQAARDARVAAGLPPDAWVTGLADVVGLHRRIAQRSEPAPVSPTVVEAEQALRDWEQAKPTGPDMQECWHCRGQGVELTDAGMTFADFLERHGFMRGLMPRTATPAPRPTPRQDEHGQDAGPA